MSRSLITIRLRSIRRDLALESLECRQVMSATASTTAAAGQLLEMISVTPRDGQIFSVGTAPQQIVVNLKAAQLAGLPPVAFSWSDDAIVLEQLGADDRIGVVGDRSNPTPAVLDPAAQTATIPLASPLEPGRYRIVLTGGSTLAQLLSDPSWDSDKDNTLAEFRVDGNTATLGDALDLGTVGSTIGTASGALDLQGRGVDLYKITLGTSQPLWRLGLQVDAQRIGSLLRSTLTLFDQQGHALAYRSAGEGLGSTVNDPYLFAALEPGVYYVGVSGEGNVGGLPGGYDPTTGSPGISSGVSVVGSYRLEVVADPVSSANQVVGFSLKSADPTSASPTGFSISFSDAIAPNSLTGDSLFVLDQQGRRIPVLLSSAGSGLDQLEFWFSQPLAPGQYSLVVPQGEGLTDLIGRTPIAPGLPAGTLATWVVDAPSKGGGGEAGIPTGFTRISDTVVVANGTAVLAAGGDVTYRFFIPPRMTATLITDGQPYSLRVVLKKTDGTVVVGSGLNGLILSSELDRSYADLDGGGYLLTLSAVGLQPMTISWSLTLMWNRADPIPNAVGSAGALGLRFGGASSISATAPIGSTSAPPLFAAPGPGSITTLPSSYTITVVSTLVGRPSEGNDAIATVGSSRTFGLVALADAGRGRTAGIGYGDDGLLRDPEGLVVTMTATDDIAERSGPRTLNEKPRQDVDETRGDEADVLALLEADRLANTARSVGWWLFGDVEDDRGAIATADRLDPATRASVEATEAQHRRDLRADLEQSGKVERAALGAPVSLVIAAAAAFRFRQIARKWWRRSRTDSATSKATQAPLWRGPRYMVPPGRRMSQARNARHV